MDKIIGVIGSILNTPNFTNLFKGQKQKQREFVLELAEKMHQSNKRQIDVNIKEAQHKSIFVAGWRPYIGWICGTAIGYNFILQPFLLLIFSAFKIELELPELKIEQLISILLAMLGMWTNRTYEKIKLK